MQGQQMPQMMILLKTKALKADEKSGVTSTQPWLASTTHTSAAYLSIVIPTV